MNNQVVLSALKAQLETKQSEVKLFHEEVYGPNMHDMTMDVFGWLKQNVSPLIQRIHLSQSTLEIMRSDNPKSGWGACTISLNTEWHNDRTTSLYARMNWYSSSATVKDQNVLNDVAIFGAVAYNLDKIERLFIDEWMPKIKEISKPLEDLNDEVSRIESSIREIERNIKTEELQKYKRLGFELTLSPDYTYSEDGVVERPKAIQLQYSRSKWDYVWLEKFKCLGMTNRKYVIEYWRTASSEDQKQTVVVSEKYMEEFIKSVYDWQTKGSQHTKDWATERYQKNYAKTA